jgi:uncharacterized membrane protein
MATAVRPGERPAVADVVDDDFDEPVLPSREDPLVRRGSEVIGGPAGDRVRSGTSWWSVLRVLVVLSFVVSMFGVVQKEHCRTHDWAAPDDYVHACYSDLPSLYYARGLADGEVPYLGQPAAHRVEYPVLTGAAMWFAAKFVPGPGSGVDRTRWYFDVNAILFACCFAIAVVATALTHRRRPWDAAIVALSPGVLLAGTINWDLWAVALTAVAMLMWARERVVLAGVLIGLGAAAKFYPLFLLGPLLLLCLRAGRMRDFGRMFAAAAGAWLVVNVPVMLADYQGWKTFYSLSHSRKAGFSSIWLALDLYGHAVPAGRLNLVAGGLFALLCVGIAVLAFAAPRRPRLAQLAFLTVAAFLLTNKVYSPQYVVWLVPLAALARPRWRDYLIWQATEVVHYVGVWLYLVGYDPSSVDRGLSPHGYVWTILAHVAGTLYLSVRIVLDILRPEADVVRADGSDDPGGGVLDGEPDRLRLRLA